MVEPRRLLEQLGAGLERDLLISGSTERAPLATRRRLEGAILGAAPLACAVVAPPEAAALAGGSAGAPSTSALFAAAAKWLAIGVFAGGTLSSAAAGVAASLAGPGPELYALSSVARHVADATSRMKAARGPQDPDAAARAPEAKPRQTALRRPSGTVFIGPPATTTGRANSPDPNGAARASTSER
jgi:hypothetical protein